ncbi:hypothetical protein BKA62DRAFT_177836 [Auriculariales sp. MPI-PUGE-AT-0066]|nr:hypothetical protein BKA62DRAFT_177836 [Auriculariales sp. MPI-PUGE-AT-0066]
MPLEPSSSTTLATSSTSPSAVLATPPPPASGGDRVGLAVGLALGLTVAALALVLVVLLFLSCRRKRNAITVSQRQELEPMAYRPNSISNGSVGSIEPLVLTNPLPSLWSASSSARRVRHAMRGDSDLASARLSTHYSTVLGDATTTHYSTVVGDATASCYSTVVGDATTICSPVPAYSPGLFHQFDHAPAPLSSSKSKFSP